MIQIKVLYSRAKAGVDDGPLNLSRKNAYLSTLNNFSKKAYMKIILVPKIFF